MPASTHVFKRVLYYALRRSLARDFFQALEAAPRCRARTGAAGPVVTCGAATFGFVPRFSVQATLEALHKDFYNLVLLDLREPVHGRRSVVGFERGLALLDAMDQEPDIERRYGFHRILVLVSGADPADVDERIAQLGARGVGRVMRDTTVCHLHPECGYLPEHHTFARHVIDEMAQITLHRRVGRRALCASGGGITGLYFEIGALKCLEDCCSTGTLNACDLYFGISAGSVVTGMLANGFTVGEIMAGIAGVEGGRIPPFDLNLLDAAHLDLHGLTAPIRQVFALARQGVSELMRGRMPLSLESLVFEYGDLLHAPFNTSGFEALLAQLFSQPGCHNDFRGLKGRLFIGATDQDRKEHVLFGEPPFDEVPVSRAIQASMSINPVFAPTEIDGRYYEDGAVTRTSNFIEAMHKGADLVFALDPLVPYVSRDPGYARSRGIFYNADQDIRTISYTRYETTRNWALRRHPEVSVYTFLPANQLRQVMSVNPMDHRPYLEIWRGAYLSTIRRLHTLGYRMRGDLAVHGIGFDTARADAVAERLGATERPSFADFFPEGRVELQSHPIRRRARRPSREVIRRVSVA